MATFTGTSYNDVANATNAILTGFTGGTLDELQDAIGDTITGGAGADTVVAGSGDDTINLASGDFVAGESIDGGAGTDTIVLNNGSTIDFRLGTIVNIENLISGSGVETIDMTADQFRGLNFIDLGTGTDTLNVHVSGLFDFSANTIPTLSRVNNVHLFGSDGDETITLTGAQILTFTRLDFGAGVDSLIIRTTSDFALPGTIQLVGIENRTIVDNDNGHTITGTGGADTIIGNGGNDTINGGSGNDRIVATSGNDGADVYDGGSGNDTADYSAVTSDLIVTLNGATAATVTVAGGDIDTIVNFEHFIGGSGNDSITGDSLKNQLFGGEGNDTINGLGGSDTLDGGAGDDTINGGDGGDAITGGSGNDTLNGGAGDDRIIATSGSDGADVYDGGSGNDTADYSAVTNDLIVTLNGATAATVTVVGGDNDTLLNIERFTGGSGNDQITGDGLKNRLFGGDGNDTINGLGGSDTLDGGAGDDTINGGDGNDVITGGAGNDVIDGGAHSDTIIGGAGADTMIGGPITGTTADTFIIGSGEFEAGEYIDGGGGTDIILLAGTADFSAGTLIRVETLNGSAGDETVTMTAAQLDAFTTIALGEGTDSLTIKTTDNFVFSASVPATFTGVETIVIEDDAGAHSLTGSVQADTIRGNGGNDTIDGGLGDDTFVFNSGFGNDTIQAFGDIDGNNDVIEFSNSLFADFAAVQAAMTQVGNDVIITYDDANTITLKNVTLSTLDADDFRFV